MFCPVRRHCFNSSTASPKVIHSSAAFCFQIKRRLCCTSSKVERFGSIWHLIDLVPCTIEEFDQRIFLYAKNVAQPNSKILVKTVNSDVVVIAISIYHCIPNLYELWAEFGRGKYIAVQTIASNHGVMLSSVLAFFQALSGSDTNSSIFSESKETFYDRWKLFPEITKVLVKLASAL